MNDHETRIAALEKARREVEDALLVQGHLEARLSNTTKQLAENAERDRQRLDRHERMNQETDKRISDLVSAIGSLIAKLPDPSARP